MSPIHDQSYRRYQGSRQPAGHAWRVIAGAGIRAMLAKRAYVFLLILSLIPFVVNAVRIYFAVNFPSQAGTIFGVNPHMFRSFLDRQATFVFFMTIWAGAGLIANDRRANALQIYLSKPVTPAEYVWGKFAVLGTLLRAEANLHLIFLGLAIGGAIGIPLAYKTPMTAVPQLTALSHAFGAVASALIGTAEFYEKAPTGFTMAALGTETLQRYQCVDRLNHARHLGWVVIHPT